MRTVFVWMAMCGGAFTAGAVLAGYGLLVAVKALVPEPGTTT